mmetsp:Transcript_52002/g.135399  ORF Transcript_52002/g.135399 Transcript_52002/m.135399 type:complete len:144 (-) Transcript_52002:236-667(-)
MPSYIEQFCLAASRELGSGLVVADTSVVIMGLGVVTEITVNVETVVSLTVVVVDTEIVVSLMVVVVDTETVVSLTETVVSLTDVVVDTDIVVVAVVMVVAEVTFPSAGRLQHQHRQGFAAPKNLCSMPSAAPFSQFARPMTPT